MTPIADFLTSAATWTWQNSLHGSLLILALLLLAWLGGSRLAPRLRTALWIIVGVRLLLPFAPESVLSIWNVAPGAEHVRVSTFDPAPVEIPTISATSEISTSPHPPGSPSQNSPSPLLIASLIWLTGLFSILTYAFLRQIRTARWIRSLPPVTDSNLRRSLNQCARKIRLPLRVQLVQAPAGIGVAVFGFLRVTHLIVPSDLERRYAEPEIRGIFLHELEHIRRHDLLWNWATLAVQALHWFNPLAWLAGRRFLADREIVCDRAALESLPSETRQNYGATLIKALEFGRTSTPAPNPALVPFISRKNELKHRLTMIMKSPRQSFLAQLTIALLAAAICLATFTSATADDDERERRSPRDGDREEIRGDRRDDDREERRTTRDGDREGERSREGDRERGDREGEFRREGDRERGEREDARDHDRAREGDEREMHREGQLRVTVFKNAVLIGDKEVALVNLRRELETSRAGSAIITAKPDVPFQSVATVMNALKDSGIREVRIATDREGDNREMRRDGEGDRPREGARDGDRPREGARDGDRPREGARDGDRPREGARDGDRPRHEAREGDAVSAFREGARDGESAEMDQRFLNQQMRIYRAYDKDENGGVTFEEWVAMKNYELTSEQRQLEEDRFRAADTSEDGKITLGEWIDWKASQQPDR